MHVLQYSASSLHNNAKLKIQNIFTISYTSFFLKYNTSPNDILQPRWSPKNLSITLSAPVSRHDHHRQKNQTQHNQKQRVS